MWVLFHHNYAHSGSDMFNPLMTSGTPDRVPAEWKSRTRGIDQRPVNSPESNLNGKKGTKSDPFLAVLRSTGTILVVDNTHTPIEGDRSCSSSEEYPTDVGANWAEGTLPGFIPAGGDVGLRSAPGHGHVPNVSNLNQC